MIKVVKKERKKEKRTTSLHFKALAHEKFSQIVIQLLWSCLRRCKCAVQQKHLILIFSEHCSVSTSLNQEQLIHIIFKVGQYHCKINQAYLKSFLIFSFSNYPVKWIVDRSIKTLQSKFKILKHSKTLSGFYRSTVDFIAEDDGKMGRKKKKRLSMEEVYPSRKKRWAEIKTKRSNGKGDQSLATWSWISNSHCQCRLGKKNPQTFERLHYDFTYNATRFKVPQPRVNYPS